MAPGGPAIALDDVRFVWPGRGDCALEVAAFEVRRGKRLLLSGPSGSGKSRLPGLSAQS